MTNTIAEVAPTLADLKKLTLEVQSRLLLAQLDAIYPQERGAGGLNKHNLLMQGDPSGLARGYSEPENSGIRQHLLGAPWTELVNRGYLVDPRGQGWFFISDEGKEALKGTTHVMLSRGALGAVELLCPELRRSQQDFREGRFKSAVLTAFQRVENRLNEIRDASSNRAVAGKTGVNLPHALFDSALLKLPFPNLGAGDSKRQGAYTQSLRNILSGAIGFVRSAFDHEPHNLPDLDERSALELLFFASYLLRTVEASENRGAAAGSKPAIAH